MTIHPDFLDIIRRAVLQAPDDLRDDAWQFAADRLRHMVFLTDDYVERVAAQIVRRFGWQRNGESNDASIAA